MASTSRISFSTTSFLEQVKTANNKVIMSGLVSTTIGLLAERSFRTFSAPCIAFEALSNTPPLLCGRVVKRAPSNEVLFLLNVASHVIAYLALNALRCPVSLRLACFITGISCFMDWGSSLPPVRALKVKEPFQTESTANTFLHSLKTPLDPKIFSYEVISKVEDSVTPIKRFPLEHKILQDLTLKYEQPAGERSLTIVKSGTSYLKKSDEMRFFPCKTVFRPQQASESLDKGIRDDAVYFIEYNTYREQFKFALNELAKCETGPKTIVMETKVSENDFSLVCMAFYIAVKSLSSDDGTSSESYETLLRKAGIQVRMQVSQEDLGKKDVLRTLNSFLTPPGVQSIS